jgi:hypothetical protein
VCVCMHQAVKVRELNVCVCIHQAVQVQVLSVCVCMSSGGEGAAAECVCMHVIRR